MAGTNDVAEAQGARVGGHRRAVLGCDRGHVLLWPEHVTPHPRTCPNALGTNMTCGRPLTRKATVTTVPDAVSEGMSVSGTTQAGSHPTHPDEDWCEECTAGDGDPRCLRCRNSVGFPGCSCEGGPTIGPCLQTFRRTERDVSGFRDLAAERDEAEITAQHLEIARLRAALQEIRDIKFNLHESAWDQADRIAAAALDAAEVDQ